ncbi:MAG: SAM-dependent methyltransferase [Rhizobiaceae bacterium]|nr:SAM-dependent methyltransferase [Rhizobiaceae bacterium]
MSTRPNALERLIADIVAREGPITVERYWDLALFHPEHGYYTSRDPFGATGDFVTAPEVSQMFGELLGAWIVAAWRALGAPSPFVFAEMGPGRGTLMADMLRTARQIDKAFLNAARIVLVETSDRLALVQSRRLDAFDLPIRHVKRLADVGAGPLLLVANELFDAVAIRQLVRVGDGWRERRVGLDAEGRLEFTVAAQGDGAADFDAAYPPLSCRTSPPQGGRTGSFGDMPISLLEGEMSGRTEGGASRDLQTSSILSSAILELSPQRLAIADTIAAKIASYGGAALIIDYGHAKSGYGDTLQAVKHHAFADPLAAPGERDITSHVDFESLAERFAAAGLTVAPIMEQGEFLLRLGLAERAGALGRDRSAEEAAAIEAAARRLAGTGKAEMGSLFKVLAASSMHFPMPPFPSQSLD